VLPIVTEEFANCALGMALVPRTPVEELYVNPELPATLTAPLALVFVKY